MELNQARLFSHATARKVLNTTKDREAHYNIVLTDAFEWLENRPPLSIHAVVTDPPYGLIEYKPLQLEKMKNGHGGVWRLPPSYDGHTRSPLPRFTVLTSDDKEYLSYFFFRFAKSLLPTLVPGAHVFLACNPLLSHFITSAFVLNGFEIRGTIVRLITTLRGGDRPKNAHVEFPDISVMPRSSWEPWLLFRKPCEGTVAGNLRKWGTGGLKRRSSSQPFADVIQSSPARGEEREIAPHPSLKPQRFVRALVRASLPNPENSVLIDPFMGSGSTIAAANALGITSIGLEVNPEYYEMAKIAIPKLASMKMIIEGIR